ncbi:MAG: TonB-dependent receptor [Bacteroidetes bacterium]|nr:TonB-dependent receptor [Bacteroidota bacterium]
MSLLLLSYSGNWDLPGSLDSLQKATNPQQANSFSKKINARVEKDITRVGLTYQWDMKNFDLETTFFNGQTIKHNPYGTSRFFNGNKYENLASYGNRTKLSSQYRYKKLKAKTIIGIDARRLDDRLLEFSIDTNNTNDYYNGFRQNNNTLSATSSIFIQQESQIGKNLNFSGGISWNDLSYDHTDHIIIDSTDHTGTRVFRRSTSPRFAVSYLIANQMVFGSVSNGYSPPGLWEVLQSDGSINDQLEAETGISYDMGARGKFIEGRLFYDLTLFSMRLRDMIIPQTLKNGQTIYRNTGTVDQKGLEGIVRGRFLLPKGLLDTWWSFTYYNFRFESYTTDSMDLKNNNIPGIPTTTIAAGMVYTFNNALSIHLNGYHSGQVFLNNLNTETSPSYLLLGFKLSYQVVLNNNSMVLYFGSENLTNSSYSSFHQLNDARGRYYNPSVGRTFFGGVRINYSIL